MASVEISIKQEIGGLFPVDTQEVFQFTSSDHQAFRDSLTQLWRDGCFTDIRLEVDGTEIPCHRHVLAAASVYFKQQLQADLTLTKLVVNDVAAPTLRKIVQYLYQGKVEATHDEVKAIVKAAIKFHLSDLTVAVDGYIAKHVVTANALGLFEFARTYNLPLTMASAQEVFNKHAEDMLQERRLDAEFTALSEEGLKDLLSSDDIVVSDECLIYFLVERWLNAVFTRKTDKLIARVLTKVRLTRCSVKFLLENVEKGPLLKGPEAKEVLNRAKNDKLMNIIEKGRRCPETDIVLIGGNDGSNFNQKCWILHHNQTSWEEFSMLPSYHGNHTHGMGVCVVGDKLLVTGGGNGKTSSHTASLLDLESRQWQLLPNMKEARAYHGVTVVGQAPGQASYVFGGWCTSDHTHIKSVEKFNLSSGQWQSMSSMPEAMSVSGAIIVGDTIYLIGYGNKTTLAYNPSSDTWTRKAPMPFKCLPAACRVGDQIYAAGDGQCMQYNPHQDTWTVLSPPGHIHRCPAAVYLAHKGTILLCGGNNADSPLKITHVIEEYCVGKDEWRPYLATLPKALCYHSMVPINR